jgi:hypothetical protein
MRKAELDRLAALWPKFAAIIVSPKKRSVNHAIETAAHFGGIYGWGIEQVRFLRELVRPDIVDSSWDVAFSRTSPMHADTSNLRAMPVTDSSIMSYRGVDDSGVPLRILVSRPGAAETTSLDTRIIRTLVNMAPRELRWISKPDLARLVKEVSVVALAEADLQEEIRGLGVGADSRLFQVPRVLGKDRFQVIETDMGGVEIDAMPDARRAAVYSDAVLRWSRMLCGDGILQIGLRRDHILVQDDDIEITRWAGTRHPGSIPAALLRSLVLAAFGGSSLIRSANQRQAGELLTDGLGLGKEVAEFREFCFSLISSPDALKWRKWRLPEAVVPDQRASGESRVEVLLMIRQLLWLRDLGLHARASDLTAPWRELCAGLMAG